MPTTPRPTETSPTKSTINAILPEAIPTIWAIVKPLIVPALEDFPVQTHEPRHVFDELAAGIKTLWVVLTNGQLEAIVITHTYAAPRGRVWVVWLLAGGGLSQWGAEVERHMVEAARRFNCIGIEAYGRLGWKPRAEEHAWTVQHFYSKEIR